MDSFFSGPIFRYGIIPLVSAGLGMFIKYVSRSNEYAKFRKEDIAVGLELMRTVVLAYCVLMSDRLVFVNVLQNEIAARHEEQGEVIRQLTQIFEQDPGNSEKIQEFKQQQRDLDRLIAETQERARKLGSTTGSAIWVLLVMVLGVWGMATVVNKKGWIARDTMHPLWGVTYPLVFGVLYITWLMLLGETK